MGLFNCLISPMAPRVDGSKLGLSFLLFFRGSDCFVTPVDAEYDSNRKEGDLADKVKTRKRGITAGGRRERRQERREKAGRQIRNEEIRKKEDGSIKKINQLNG